MCDIITYYNSILIYIILILSFALLQRHVHGKINSTKKIEENMKKSASLCIAYHALCITSITIFCSDSIRHFPPIDFTGQTDPVVTAPYQPQKSTASCCLLDAAMTRPKEVLIQVRSMYMELMEAVKVARLYTDGNDLECYIALVQQYQAQCPLFGLSECVNITDGTPCRFSRVAYPKRRSQFEKKVSTALVECSRSSNHPVQYVGFGVGDMFSDFINVLGMLVQNPGAQCDMHCIEKEFSPFVLYNTIYESIRTGKDEDDYDKVARAFLPVVPAHMEENIMKGLIDNVRCCLKSFMVRRFGFLNYFTKTFPAAKISLRVHDSVRGYYAYSDQHSLPGPDVIAAVDIEDIPSIMNYSMQDYISLCSQAIAKKNTARYVWLSGIDSDFEKVSLVYNDRLIMFRDEIQD